MPKLKMAKTKDESGFSKMSMKQLQGETNYYFVFSVFHKQLILDKMFTGNLYYSKYIDFSDRNYQARWRLIQDRQQRN
jgi:hypothetical protein